ncbi:MAG: PfkB family carbohydrate kinase [Solirubrobacterales bacterium]
MRTLCLGEALVDLVCERPVASLADADRFAAHCGGAVANAAVAAARCGADVALAGGVGDDPWGAWLERRLQREGVDLRWFNRVPGSPTPLAFVTVDTDGEPHFTVYGQSIPATMRSTETVLEEAVEACDALFFGSNTLVGPEERAITLLARELALGAGKPVLFDPNLRLHRWPDPEQAIGQVLSSCEGAALLKVNHDEAAALTGKRDPGAAAEALRAAGAETVVVTLGADGALARGEVTTAVGGVPVRPVDTTGAGDVVAGILIAALEASDYAPVAIESALAFAVEAASRSTEGWGAIDALPDRMPVFA